jgi:hypothetical protein
MRLHSAHCVNATRRTGPVRFRQSALPDSAQPLDGVVAERGFWLLEAPIRVARADTPVP